jgi:hypothetical protein
MRDEVMDEIERQGWLFEWYSKKRLAILIYARWLIESRELTYDQATKLRSPPG